MLQRLLIRNFQRHERRAIDFACVTTIVGDNDEGKSSILRAIRWLCLNRPSGSEFINWDADSVRVTLQVDDHKVKRARGKANTYQLDAKTFKAFGNDVPEPIAKLLNVSELNFQGQHESPFWFTLSPGQVSKELNQIIDLGSIDETLANLGKKLRKAKVTVDITKDRLAEAKQAQAELADVPDLDEELTEVEELEAKAAKLDYKQDRLESLVEAIEHTQEKQKKYADILEPLTAYNQLLEQLEDTLEQHEQLSKLIDNIQQAQKDSSQCQKQLKRTEAKLHELGQGKCPLCGR